MPPMLPPLAERRPDLAVAPADLRLDGRRPRRSTFTTTAELEAPRTLLGQRRAVEALELGLSMRSPGSHVFAAGYPGTGRAHRDRRGCSAGSRRGCRCRPTAPT